MQTSVLRIQEDGALLKVFGVQTDITDLGGFINRSLFFHGLNGANSFKITNVWKGDLQEKTSFQQSLTKRELEITTLLAEGMSTKEIARHLHVSEETVHSHRKNLLKKTKSKNTVELIANMVRSGWI